MNIIGWKAIQSFTRTHPDSLAALNRWYVAAKNASWTNLVDARKEFPHADLVGPLTVFNVRGNRYRLIVRIDYKWQVISVEDILTHPEYDREGWKK